MGGSVVSEMAFAHADATHGGPGHDLPVDGVGAADRLEHGGQALGHRVR